MAYYAIEVDVATGNIDFVNALQSQIDSVEFNFADKSKMAIAKDFTTAPVVGDTYAISYIEKRQADYNVESDKLYIAWQAQLQDVSSTQADKDAAQNAWNGRRDAIKLRYPKV